MATRLGRLICSCCGSLVVVGGLFAANPSATYADPPAWAPAHGWRRQHDAYYSGYTGTQWDRDYGVVSGQCDRRAIGTVLGATVGGAIGSQVGKGTGKTVATVLGAVIGGVVGAKAGSDLDSVDRACVGHALELVEDNERVTWGNPNTGVTYMLSPTRGFKQDGRICREFSLRMTVGRESQTGLSIACQAGDGTWQTVRQEVGENREERGWSKGKRRGRRDDEN